MPKRNMMAICFVTGLVAAPALTLAQRSDLRTTQPSFAFSRTDALSAARRSAEGRCQAGGQRVDHYDSEDCEQVRDTNNNPAWQCVVAYRCTARR